MYMWHAVYWHIEIYFQKEDLMFVTLSSILMRSLTFKEFVSRSFDHNYVYLLCYTYTILKLYLKKGF